MTGFIIWLTLVVTSLVTCVDISNMTCATYNITVGNSNNNMPTNIALSEMNLI